MTQEERRLEQQRLIETVKRTVDIKDLAKEYGYTVDKRKSTENSRFVTMIHPNLSGITVFKSGDVSLFKETSALTSVGGAKNSIAFVQEMENVNFYTALNKLAENQSLNYDNSNKYNKYNAYTKQQTTDNKQNEALRINKAKELLSEMKEYKGSESDYLQQRGIDASLLDERFNKIIKTDKYKNAVFVERNSRGQVCGFERVGLNAQNEKVKIHSESQKGGFFVGNVKSAEQNKTLVMTESPIDALSYARLKGDLGKGNKSEMVYLSTGGQFGAEQKQIIKNVLASDKINEIKLAFDNDKKGDEYAKIVADIAKEHGIKTTREKPEKEKDWNEKLLKDLSKEVLKDKAIDSVKAISQSSISTAPSFDKTTNFEMEM